MLELQNVGFRVQTEDGTAKDILKHINLTVDERFVAITGPNGGGKSTLAKVIAGIFTPTEGKILLNGEDITHLSITERAQRVSVLPSSNRCGLRALRCTICFPWRAART